jgi:hypothetical protein
MIVSGGALMLTGVMSYLILNELGFGPSSYLAPVLVYTFPPLITFGVYDFWLVDSSAAFLVGIAFYLIFIDRYQWLLVTMVVGMGVKESILLIGPAYYLWNAESIIDTDSLKKTSLLLIVPTLALLILRFIFTTGNDEYVSFYLSQTVSQFAEWGLWTTAKKFSLWPFGLAVLLWVVSVVDERFDEFAVLIPVMFLISLQAILGGGIERYMMIAWPVATIFATLGLSRISTNLNRILPDELNLHPLFLAPPLLTILVLNINTSRRAGIPLERELLIFGCYLGSLLFVMYVVQNFGSSDDV